MSAAAQPNEGGPPKRKDAAGRTFPLVSRVRRTVPRLLAIWLGANLMASDTLRQGAERAGYELGPLIARGGMGEIYKATQLSLGRRVALKVIAAQYSEDERFRQRFRRETRVAASIDHPNVLPVFEADAAQFHDCLCGACSWGRVGCGCDGARRRGWLRAHPKRANILNRANRHWRPHLGTAEGAHPRYGRIRSV